jgi:hypothetical protein
MQEGVKLLLADLTQILRQDLLDLNRQRHEAFHYRFLMLEPKDAEV